MEDTKKVAELRALVDAIDKELVDLLNKRAKLALKIRVAKGNSEYYRPQREAEVLLRVAETNEGPLSAEAITTLFRSIVYVCRGIQDAAVPWPEE